MMARPGVIKKVRDVVRRNIEVSKAVKQIYSTSWPGSPVMSYCTVPAGGVSREVDLRVQSRWSDGVLGLHPSRSQRTVTSRGRCTDKIIWTIPEKLEEANRIPADTRFIIMPSHILPHTPRHFPSCVNIHSHNYNCRWLPLEGNI